MVFECVKLQDKMCYCLLLSLEIVFTSVDYLLFSDHLHNRNFILLIQEKSIIWHNKLVDLIAEVTQQ